jgi:predicted transposase/invertase (TIGR01784 family)
LGLGTGNEGKLEGKIEGKLEAVPALVERGFSVEEITQILGLTVEQAQSIYSQKYI